MKDALVRFVERGGTLYASDWRYDVVKAAFPEVVDAASMGEGLIQEVQAEVVDPGLKDFIGPTVLLKFDLGQWKTAAFAGPNVTTLIRGRYKRQRYKDDRVGEWAMAPLLVKFTAGKGTVIFTSFHNEKQNSTTEKKLLQYLVFTLVVADIDAKVTALNQEAGLRRRSRTCSAPRKRIPASSERIKTRSWARFASRWDFAMPGPGWS